MIRDDTARSTHGGIRNEGKLLVGNSERKRPRGTLSTDCERTRQRGRDEWRAFVNTEMNFPDP
jgi:hypothetical protein